MGCKSLHEDALAVEAEQHKQYNVGSVIALT